MIYRVLLLVALSGLSPFLLPSVCAQDVPKKVLILSSVDQYVPAIALTNMAIRTTMKEDSPSHIQFFYEAQDSFRIATEKYEGEFVGLLRRKYDGEKIDLIYALGGSALGFLVKHQGELFRDTPVVFILTDQRQAVDLNSGLNVTGVGGKIELSPTLEIALALQPQTQGVVVVAGKATFDTALVEQARTEFRLYEGRVEFTYLIGVPSEELKDKLSALPERSIVFYLSVSPDAARVYTSPEMLAHLAPSANAPIYGASQTYMGTGMIGGRLIDYEALGTRAGEMGLRILAGESPQNIASETLPSTTMFDWRELRRWGIDESRLPADSVVRFREPTFWELYKWRIVGVISLCIFEALLIVWLLISGARRRQAERESERFARVAEAERRRLDEVVSNVPGIVWETRFEADGKTRKTHFVSNYVEQMLGYSVDEWLSTPNFALAIMTDEDQERVARETEAILESGKEGALQFRWIAKDGGIHDVDAQIAAIRDETGKPVGLRGVTMDITDRKEAEAALRQSEERYRNVVETQTELICRYQPDSTLTFVNDAYCRSFGKTREELIGTKFIELLPENGRVAALSHVSSLIENPRAEAYEHEVILPNGAQGWQQWVDNVVGSSNGHGVELQGIGRDITEKRQAEQELRLSETRFRHMADTAPVMIWIADTDMRCTFFNQRVLDFTGQRMDELLGEGWGLTVHEDDFPKCVETYTAAYARKEPFVMEFRFRRADGEFRWFYDTGAPRFGSNGELLGYIGSAVDITDRRAAEEALQIAHEEVSRLKNQLEAENVYLQEEIKLAHNVDEIIGESDAIKYVLFKIEQVAHTETTVLILGETGTGKELVARAIHSQSPRKDRPLVKVNCAALSASLIESELFGHEKGAFTGATGRKIGRFELADGATIFLDEIGELPLDLQPKLLRVIQEGELERLGSSKTIKVDVRIIAATNRNMKLEVGKGTFREDLWYRLNVFPITVPPLRQRKEDIPAMVEHFVVTFSKKIGKAITSISGATLKMLQDHSWPGNVRELANVIERGVINAQGSVLHIADQLAQDKPQEVTDANQTLEQVEKEHIAHILDQTSWRIEGPSGAAKILGLNPSTLRTRMQKLGIHKSIRSFSQGSGITS